MNLKRYLPILDWAPQYRRNQATSDLVAAVIVTVMLIPQSLAYALLAGLPAQVGLYASILPLVIYAVFGTSRTLSVGPVAVASLMTAAALAPLAEAGTPEYVSGAILLAVMSGLMLTLMGVFRLGFLANFLSHPVISGFITASGIVIAASQLKHIFGIQASGHNLLAIGQSLIRSIGDTNPATLAVGIGALLFLVLARKRLKPLLMAVGLAPGRADILTKTAPILAVLATTLVAWQFQLDARGVRLVGDVPRGLPELALPSLDMGLWQQLAVSALLISVVGFVESVSVGQTLAAKRRQRIDPDQELIGLGTANLGAGFSGGMPVTGGFSRSVVNFDAGAETPAAGAYAAVGNAVPDAGDCVSAPGDSGGNHHCCRRHPDRLSGPGPHLALFPDGFRCHARHYRADTGAQCGGGPHRGCGLVHRAVPVSYQPSSQRGGWPGARH